MNKRIVIIGFAAGALASFLAGKLTSGLATPYAFVALLSWHILSRLGSGTLANESFFVMALTALMHGLLFAIIVVLARRIFPRLKENELGGNVLLVAAFLYWVLLAFAFPVSE